MSKARFNISGIIEELKSNQSVFKSLLENVDALQLQWRPSADKWNLLEIVSHLLDEETQDFRARVEHALYYPEKKLVPIDPEGWVQSHNYASNDYQATLNLFLEERKTSVKWLMQLEDVNWKSALHHPELGKLSAEVLLLNWLTHDYLHIRQILRYKFELLKLDSNIDLNYAGAW
ncbi:MAG: DinB family protein [Jejuia sp.]